MFLSGSDGPILLSTPLYTPSMPTFAELLPSFWGARDSVQEPLAWRHRAWTRTEKQRSMCEPMSHQCFAKEGKKKRGGNGFGIKTLGREPSCCAGEQRKQSPRPLSKANLYKKLFFTKEWRKGGLCVPGVYFRQYTQQIIESTSDLQKLEKQCSIKRNIDVSLNVSFHLKETVQ